MQYVKIWIWFFLRSSTNSDKFFKCLKLYILKEEWFHENNLKQEVSFAESFVSETLELPHHVFPRWDKDRNEEGQGWAVSKFHGITKFVLYMKLFGGAINFYGGIGKSNHKKFVKDTGLNTHKRIRTFTSQVAQRYYEGMTLRIAKKCLESRTDNNHHVGE
jgi:hypothetical protein